MVLEIMKQTTCGAPGFGENRSRALFFEANLADRTVSGLNRLN